MRIEVTVPVTLTVEYDTDGEVIDQKVLEDLTSFVLKNHVMDILDGPHDLVVEDLTETTGWCINGASISVPDKHPRYR